MNGTDSITSDDQSDPGSAFRSPRIAPPLCPDTGAPLHLTCSSSEPRQLCGRKGRIIFPLRSRGEYKKGFRQPRRKRWQTTVHETNELLAWLARGGWLGLLPASLGLWCVDVDEGGEDAVHAIIEALGEPLAISRTRRGWHLWYPLQEGAIVDNSDWECGPGRGELRGSNGFVVLWEAGPVIEAARRTVNAKDVSPNAILKKAVKVDGRAAVPAAVNGGAEGERVNGAGAVTSELRSALRHLSRGRLGDSPGYTTWIRVGMALHSETGGSEAGLSLWDEWSKGFDNYPSDGEPTTAEKWKTFGAKREEPRLTGRTVYKLAREHGWKGRRANGHARKGNGLSPSLLAGSDSDSSAVPLEALSEGHFARDWADDHGPDEFLYARGEEWLRYESGRWRHAGCAARQSMSETIKGVVEGTEVAKRFDCHRVVCGALSMAGYERTEPVESFDANCLLVPFPNGKVLDVKDWKKRPAAPADRIRKTLAVYPGPGASAKWVQFLDQALSHYPAGEREKIAAYIQEWCGLALTGDCREEAALFVWGDAGCGKSTFFETLIAVMGSLGSTVSGKRVAGEREDHRQWLARLQGKRLVVINELPERGRWNTEDLNALIDGGPIEANRMRQDSIEFTSQAHVHPHRRQLPRSMEPRQHQRIAPVGLHSLPTAPRYQARRHHLASVTRLDDLPIHPVPARSRLIAKTHHLPVRAQAANEPQQRLALILHHAPVHRLLASG